MSLSVVEIKCAEDAAPFPLLQPAYFLLCDVLDLISSQAANNLSLFCTLPDQVAQQLSPLFTAFDNLFYTFYGIPTVALPAFHAV